MLKNNYKFSDNDLVYDVGAHKGEDTSYYLKIGYKVVAIEANPELVEQLNINFRQYVENGNLIIVNQAISDTSGTAVFYRNLKVSEWGTLHKSWKDRNLIYGASSEEIRVNCIKLDEIVSIYGSPFYMKIDIEGYDDVALDSLSHLEVLPRYVSIEAEKKSLLTLYGQINKLRALGYIRFKFINQRSFKDICYINKFGQVSLHEFSKGSSGPFGHQIKFYYGIFLAHLIATVIYIRYFFFGDYSILFRYVSRIYAFRFLRRFNTWHDLHASYK